MAIANCRSTQEKWEALYLHRLPEAERPDSQGPPPYVDTILDEVAGHEMYSFMDGFLGYNRIKLAPEDKEKITFITECGAFAYNVMPFGLCNAPSTFQRLNTVFQDFLLEYMKCFLDDFNVYSDTLSHLSKLRHCFEKCREYGIGINPEKSVFLVHSDIMLGYVVCLQGNSRTHGRSQRSSTCPVQQPRRTSNASSAWCNSIDVSSKILPPAHIPSADYYTPAWLKPTSSTNGHPSANKPSNS